MPPQPHRHWILLQNTFTLGALIAGPLFSFLFPGLENTIFLAAPASLGLLLGAAIGILGTRTLGKNRTPHPTPLPTSQLVQHGIYSLIRHPLYASLILLTHSWSLLWRSWPALVFSCLLTGTLILKAKTEETLLLLKFPEYSAYLKRTKRFVPYLW